MTHTAPKIRDLLDEKHVGPTPQGTGIQLKLEINVYESGTVTVNGRPVQWDKTNRNAGTWLSVVEIVIACITMFFGEKIK